MSTTEKFTEDQVFNKWMGILIDIKNFEKGEFVKRVKQLNYMDQLVFLMRKHGVDYDDASSIVILNKAIDFLVTERGKKATDWRKSWVPDLKVQFNASLGKYYIPDVDMSGRIEVSEEEISELRNKDSGVKKRETSVDNIEFLIPEDDGVIRSWVDRKYGGSKFAHRAARDPMSFLFLEFMEDTFGKYLV